MRHGKADGQIGGKKDIDRPLTDLGRKRNEIIGRELKKKKVLPQYIISSPAIRAMQTAQHMADQFSIDQSAIAVNDDLYFKTVNDYFDALYSIPDEFSSVMIVGHNPLVTQFANFFLNQKIIDMPTSGLIALQSDARSWPEFVIAYKNALFQLIPKNLENEKE